MKHQDNSSQSELKQLWGKYMPPLTPEQADLSVKLWHKIQARKQRQSGQEAIGYFQTEIDR